MKLELGGGSAFTLIGMKLWINLQAKAAGTRNWHSFKTKFNHFMQGLLQTEKQVCATGP